MATTSETFDYILRSKYQDQLTGAANASFNRFKKSGQAAMKAVQIAGVAAFAAVAASMVKMTSEVLRLGDQFDKLSKRLGLSVEFLSQLEFAAERSGVQFSVATKAVQNMQNVLVETAEKGTGPGAEAFARLNLNVRDFIGLPANEALSRISSAMANMTDRSQQVATAVDIFGARGTAMLQIINDGAGGFEALARESNELGITMSGRTSTAVAGFNDLMSDLWKVVRGFVANGLTPLLEHVSKNREAFISLAKGAGQLVSFGFKTMMVSAVATANTLNYLTGFVLKLAGAYFNLRAALTNSQAAQEDYQEQARIAFEAAAGMEEKIISLSSAFEDQEKAAQSFNEAFELFKVGMDNAEPKIKHVATGLANVAQDAAKAEAAVKKLNTAIRQVPARGRQIDLNDPDAPTPRTPTGFRDDLETRVRTAAEKLREDRKKQAEESEFNRLVERFASTPSSQRTPSFETRLFDDFTRRQRSMEQHGFYGSSGGGSGGSSSAGMVVQGDIIVEGSIVSGDGFGDQSRRYSQEKGRQAGRSGNSKNPNGIGTSDTYLGLKVHKPNFTF